jgi:UDP-N-acetylglucosamine--N-acetylmuramyl-(pentapeptide) pyrophosphoryl-undecaprenol N-acetylglucosamine transferase
MVITGGGTGGHFFPAIAIKEALVENGVQVKYIGSKYGIEAKKQYFNDEILLLDIKGIQRQFNIESLTNNILFPIRFCKAYYVSRKFLKKFNPDLVIGTGGYSSGLPLIASIHLGIKTVIQEQNSYPGITTRFLSKYCNKVLIAYQEAEKYFKKKVVITGNPVRNNIKMINKVKAKLNLNLNAKLPVILIMGGSQGSKPMNFHFIKKYHEYLKHNIQIIWQCGKNDYNYIKNQINEENIYLIPFSDDMSSLYSAADLVISRSGALALSEMALMGKAMVLVPFPYSAGNHQQKNAESFSNSGAAILIYQENLIYGELEKTIIKLLKNKHSIKQMEEKSIQMAAPNATDVIINTIMRVAIS